MRYKSCPTITIIRRASEKKDEPWSDSTNQSNDTSNLSTSYQYLGAITYIWALLWTFALYLSFLISLSSCLFLLSYMATTSMLGGEGVGEGETRPLELPPLALVGDRYHQRLLIQMAMSLNQVKRHRTVSFSLSLHWFAQSSRPPPKKKSKLIKDCW